ncbi:MAG: glycoside hydrolase family 57 protein [Acidobacteriia bacterium]|nr:glycoside hydrolase family 57 protein [Terriglobia bacterium]
MPEKIKLAFLWHMHQPYYLNPLTGFVEMPWVRLHGLKDYWGMVQMLEEFPRVHLTVNWVPSLLRQIEDFLNNPDIDPLFTLAFTPAEKLAPEEKKRIAGNFFQANYARQIQRFPRYEELHRRFYEAGEGDAEVALSSFGNQDFIDWQVLSQLCWFDEIVLEKDAQLAAWVAKGRNFTEADKEQLRVKELELIKRVVATSREFAERGQIELSTSPFFHPILPLICDTSVARGCQPDAPLPTSTYRHPEDAIRQLQLAIEQHTRIFGRRPAGLWPSEGSVSNEVLEIASQCGFRWAATDEGILGHSLNVSFERNPGNGISNSELLQRPHRFRSSPLHLFFRDRELSDALGFVYSRMETGEAVNDLVGRLKSIASNQLAEPCISIILDGENAWEFFPNNGRPFLKELYKRLSDDPQFECVTFSEVLESGRPNAGALESVWPGSWINSDFRIWIGSEEDNRAWNLLAEARETFELAKGSAPDADSNPKMQAAMESLWAAEGSDWCWWYGPEHSSANDARFDELFRAHLVSCYQQLDRPVPAALSEPLNRSAAKYLQVRPTGKIHPTIDGRATSYFEWLWSGRIEEAGTTMHFGKKAVECLYYGWDEEWLYVRLDLLKETPKNNQRHDVKVYLDDTRYLLAPDFTKGDAMPDLSLCSEQSADRRPLGKQQAEAAFADFLELKVRKSLWRDLGLARVSFYVVLDVNGVPGGRFPAVGAVAIDETPLE